MYRNVLALGAGKDFKNVTYVKLRELSRTVSGGNQTKEAKPALPKQKRDNDEGFWQWLEDNTPNEIGKIRKAESYLQVYRNVLADSATKVTDIPMNKLIELSRTKRDGGSTTSTPALPKQKRDALLASFNHLCFKWVLGFCRCSEGVF